MNSIEVSWTPLLSVDEWGNVQGPMPQELLVLSELRGIEAMMKRFTRTIPKPFPFAVQLQYLVYQSLILGTS